MIFSDKKRKVFKLAFVIIILLVPNKVFAARGCCSHHGGQNYCDTSVGKWVCNDGTYSPTCTCQKVSSTDNAKNNTNETKNDTKDNINSNKTNTTISSVDSTINNKETTTDNNTDDNIIYVILGGGLAYYFIKKKRKK